MQTQPRVQTWPTHSRTPGDYAVIVYTRQDECHATIQYKITQTTQMRKFSQWRSSLSALLSSKLKWIIDTLIYAYEAM